MLVAVSWRRAEWPRVGRLEVVPFYRAGSSAPAPYVAHELLLEVRRRLAFARSIQIALDLRQAFLHLIEPGVIRGGELHMHGGVVGHQRGECSCLARREIVRDDVDLLVSWLIGGNGGKESCELCRSLTARGRNVCGVGVATFQRLIQRLHTLMIVRAMPRTAG